jgi:mRNA interferase MazF
MKLERYGVYLANLNPSRGSEINKIRPVVVVSDDDMNASLQTIVVCPLTTTLHPNWRSRIQFMCAGRKVEIAVDQIRAIAKERCLKKTDHLSAATAKELRLLITEMYGE